MMNSSATATVSAVIPVHNGEAFVAEAIESVLEQTLPVVECLVIDDGSTDSTRAIVEQFGARVSYVGQRRAGVSVARNHGANIARGRFVAFLDHDDVWLPQKLARQLEAMEQQGADLGLCAVEVVDAQGSQRSIKRLRAKTDVVTGMLLFDGTETVSTSSTGVADRQFFLSSGGFDSDLGTSADWDLLFRMLLEGQVAYVDDPLVRYRIHGANMSRNIGAMERDMQHAFGKAFANPRLPEALRHERRRAYARLYRMLAGSYRDSGDRRAAVRTLAIALRHDPRIAVELIRRPPRVAASRPSR